MRSALILAVAGLAACSTYRVNRAALVPHTTPTLRSGSPMEAPAEVALGLSSVTHVGELGSSEDDDAVEVPGTQLEGAMRVRLGGHAAIGLIYAQGLDATAQQAKPTQPAVDGGDVRGYGVSVHALIPTGDPRWSVGLAFEGLVWSVPYVEYRTCVEVCPGGPWTYVERGRSSIAQAALGVTPTYRTGRIALFGGATLRNHPTIEQKGVEGDLDAGDEVEEGPTRVVLSAGVEAELGGGVKGSLVVYQPLPGPPVAYRPSLAAMITIPLGTRDRRGAGGAVTPPVAPPPAPAPAPGGPPGGW